MSSFQLYEFQALDRVLSDADQTYLESLSSRAEITATSARYTYSYSDFRTEPLQVLDRCFDIMLYQASYGIRQLAIRLPKDYTNISCYEPYCVPDLIELKTTEKSVILNISIASEYYGTWLSEEGRLREIVATRAELLKGDLRILYLAWLASAYAEDYSFNWDTAIEPPVPPNLKKLPPALHQFADIFLIDPDLIAAAATESKEASVSQSAEPIETWIAALPETDRNQYLLRVAQGENYVGLELMNRLRRQFGEQHKAPGGNAAGRTFAQLEAASKQKADERERQKQIAAEKAEQQRLASLAPDVDRLWQLVRHLIERGQAKAYDEAVAHLKDLKTVAQRQGDPITFSQRLQEITEEFSRKRSFISRLKQAALL